MQHEGILKACGSTKAADKGDQIYDEIVRQGLLETNNVLGTLVDMYVKCSCLAKSQRVLEELPLRNVVSWNALIAGYAQEGKSEQFQWMQCEGISPDGVTFACILKTCGNIAAMDKGDQIYDEITRQGMMLGVLLDEYMHRKIADFRIAKLLGRDERKVVTFADLG